MTRRRIDDEVRSLEEALSNWIGDYGAAAAKQLGNRLTGSSEGQMSIQDKMAKEKFLQNFLGRASATLNSGIASGRITTNVTPAAQPAAPTATPTSTAPAAPAATPTSTAPAAPAAAKPSIAPKTAPPSRPTIGNTPIHAMQVKSMQNNIARDKRVANMPPPNKKTFAADKRTPAQIAQMRRAGFSESSTYDKLNAIFESIINEDPWGSIVNQLGGGTPSTAPAGTSPAPSSSTGGTVTQTPTGQVHTASSTNPNQPTAGAETISQFLTKWVKQYMTGTSFGDANSVKHIMSLIKNVEDTYSKDKGKAALTKLANDLYAVSYAQDTPPQQSNQPQPTQQPASSPAAAKPAAPANNAPSDSWASKVTENKKKPVKYWGQK